MPEDAETVASARKTPGLIWWLQGQERQNFGDYLTEFLWENLAEGDGLRIPADGYRLVGSAISDAIVEDDLTQLGLQDGGRLVFWCCGARDERPLSAGSRARSVICGVRGPLTRDVLRLPASTPMGDPALLLPLLYAPRRAERTAGRAVCAPHFFDETPDERLLERTGADVVVRPSIAATPEALRSLIDEIASADFVLAGALHAAIVACAYGVPFCYFDSGQVDVPFKWRDFSASLGIGTFFVATVAEGRKVYDTMIAARLRKPLLFPILAAAPFRVGAAHLLRAAQRDAERLGRADEIDAAAFERFVDVVDRDVGALGAVPAPVDRAAAAEAAEAASRQEARRKLAQADQALAQSRQETAESRQELAESRQELAEARQIVAELRGRLEAMSNEAAAKSASFEDMLDTHCAALRELGDAKARIEQLGARQNSWRGIARMARRRIRGKRN